MANHRLRTALRYNGEAAKIADQAHDDALQLATDILAGELVSVAAVYDRLGMTRRRWEWARAMLRLADLANHRYLLTCFDAAAIAAALLTARDVATNDPNRLRDYLPRGRQGELKRYTPR